MITFFDVETSAAPDSVLETVKPEFKAPGNYKDPAKIETAKAEAEAAWRERAALDAKTAVVLSVGLLDEHPKLFTGPEPFLLTSFWDAWNEGPKFVGFCIKSFDLPMLVQRSWITGVPVPTDLMEGRYWNRRIMDLQEIWTCYGRGTEGQSLDSICKALGLGGKNGNGKDFAKLFATDQKEALAYLQRDLELTAALGKRLGIQ